MTTRSRSHMFGPRGLWIAALLAALAARPVHADVFGWMNRQLGGMFGDEGPKSRADAARVDGYLQRLQSPEPQAPGAWTSRTMDRLAALSIAAPAPAARPRNAPRARQPAPAASFVAPREDWSPRLNDALEALRSPAGSGAALDALESEASRAAHQAARAGFGLPAQALFNLGKATEPLRRLLVSCREGLHDASSAASLDRLHRACQRLMGQIQNNHQLVQLARELIDSGASLLEKARVPVTQSLERSAQVQSVPLAAAFGEVTLRSRGNLESARGYLGRAQADLRAAFQTARSALLHVEQIKEKSFQSSASTFTLEDQPQSLDRLLAGFDRIRDSVTRAMEGMQTAHGLLYVNQKALLELLYSLRTASAPRSLRDAEVRAVAAAFERTRGILASGLESAATELARQKQWRTALEAFRTPLFELGPLPDWVFTRDTILISPVRAGATPGPGPDIERVIASLAEPPEPAPGAPEPGPRVPAATDLPLIDLDGDTIPVAASASAASAIATSTGDDAGYRLPAWY